jgi:hypothetical protein
MKHSSDPYNNGNIMFCSLVPLTVYQYLLYMY